MSRDRSPAAVARVWCERHGYDFDVTDTAHVAALVRAVRRECAAVAVGGRTDEPRWTAVEIAAAIRALNRAPRRGR